jgi:hypothetical protein
VPIAIFHQIRSPVALATLGAFFVPEPFGICFVIAAAIWWFCRKLRGEWSRLVAAGCPSQQCSHKTNFTRTQLRDIPLTRSLRLRWQPLLAKEQDAAPWRSDVPTQVVEVAVRRDCRRRSGVTSSMRMRVAVLCAQILVPSSAVSEELSPDQARAFVVGKLFAYSCFDGTAGVGRIFPDGSVFGTITPGGGGEAKFAALPPGTIKADGNSICAHLSGSPIEPCFNVQRIDDQSFRGSIVGFDFAYCDFYQRHSRAQLMSRLPH